VAVIFFGVGLLVWNWGVTKYRGAGS